MMQTLGGGTLHNSSCSIALGSSSVSVSGTTLTLNLAMSFAPAFAGTKTVRLFANAAGALASGWQDLGAFTVTTNGSTPPPPPAPTVQPGVSAVSVTPGSGSGSSQTFVLQYSDSRGATSLTSEWLWFSGGAGHCMIYHERATNSVYLLNDAGTLWMSRTIGSGTLQNNSCTVNLAGSTVSTNGGMLTLNLAISFSSGFRGTKTVQMFANAAGAISSGWQTRGTWIVP
jgi:hypothetical protein